MIGWVAAVWLVSGGRYQLLRARRHMAVGEEGVAERSVSSRWALFFLIGSGAIRLLLDLDALHVTMGAMLALFTGGAFTERSREFLASTSRPCLAKPFDEAEVKAMVAKHIRL